MKMKLSILTGCFFLAAVSQTQAQSIKGIEIGQTLQEAGAALGKYLVAEIGHPLSLEESTAIVSPVVKNFTIAGISSSYGGELERMLRLKDGKIDSFMFFFHQDRFDVMRVAFQAKYPALKCEDSELQNGYGAKFQQTICTFENLTIERRMSSGGSVLSMTDKAARYQETEVSMKKALKDL
jgi:hypothetical protein